MTFVGLRAVGSAVLATAFATSAAAQRPEQKAYDVWLGVSAEQHLIGEWAGSLSIEHRRSQGVMLPRQMNFTGTFLRDLGFGRLGLGMAHYHTSSNDEFGPARPQNERRVFEQLSASHRLVGAQWNHRLRYEQRWVASNPLAGVPRDWVYGSRVRHQIRMVRALDGRSASASKLYVAPNIEGFVRTTGRRGVFFEQTRVGVLGGVGVAARVNVELGYVRQATIRADQVREVHNAIQLAGRILGHAR